LSEDNGCICDTGEYYNINDDEVKEREKGRHLIK